MALNIKRITRGNSFLHCNIEHHRSPSGLHNKVNWLLTESKYNQDELDELWKRINRNQSWEKAFWIVNRIIDKDFVRIKEHYPEIWFWAKEYVNKERKRNEHRGFVGAHRNDDKLSEAMNLIKNIIRVTWGEGWNYSLDWKVKAEKFLGEYNEK